MTVKDEQGMKDYDYKGDRAVTSILMLLVLPQKLLSHESSWKLYKDTIEWPYTGEIRISHELQNILGDQFLYYSLDIK